MNTIWKLRYPIIIVAATFMLLFLSYKLDQSTISYYKDNMVLLQEFSQKNLELDSKILESQNLVWEEKEIKTYSQNVNKALEKIIARTTEPDFLNALNQLNNLIHKKIERIGIYQDERKKFQIVFSNFTEIVRLKAESEKEKLGELQKLTILILEYYTLEKSDNQVDRKITEKINNINLPEVTKIGSDMLAKKEMLEQKVLSISSIPIDKNIDELKNKYQVTIGQKITEHKKYKQAFYFVLIFFVVAVIITCLHLVTMSNAVDELRQLSKDLYDVFQKLCDSNYNISSSNKELLIQDNNIYTKNKETFEELHNTFENNAKKCKNTLTSLNKANLLIKESLEYTKKMVSSIKEIENTSSKTSLVVDDIQDIARQNKLVGLNATIEASRLGNQVFTVVAKEVSSLAIRSTEALTQTSKQILETQEKSKQGSLLTENLLSYLCDINVKIKNICVVTEQLNEYFEKQKTNMDNFYKNITYINERFEKYGQIAEDNIVVTEKLSLLTSKLRANVAKTLQITQKLASY